MHHRRQPGLLLMPGTRRIVLTSLHLHEDIESCSMVYNCEPSAHRNIRARAFFGESIVSGARRQFEIAHMPVPAVSVLLQRELYERVISFCDCHLPMAKALWATSIFQQSVWHVATRRSIFHAWDALLQHIAAEQYAQFQRHGVAEDMLYGANWDIASDSS